MTATVGRLVVDVLTNQTGAGVALYDFVYIDTAHDNSFTTGTTSAYTGAVGVCIEPNGIAAGASGRIQISGPCAGINLNASGTRGHYVKSYTVAKQATDAGASRVVGAFGQLKASGTTPTLELFGFPDAASSSAAAGTPAVTLSTTNSAGAASTFVATDATVAVFDATAPTTAASGAAAAAGSAGTAARRDHTHGMPVLPSITNNIVATSQTLSGNNSWVDLATAGPACTVTVGASGVVKITLTAHIGTANNGYGDMGFAASGANTIAAGTANKILRSSSSATGGATTVAGDMIISATFLLTGLSTGSTTFTAKYNQEGGAGTTTWTNREMIVEVW